MGVVETHDVVIDVCDRLSGIGITSLPHALHLEIQEEARHHGMKTPA